MLTVNRKIFTMAAVSVLMLGLTGIGMASIRDGKTLGLANQVRTRLMELPYLSVFDNLSCAVEGSGTVILTGQVIRPSLKTDAEAAVLGVPGVTKVVNSIEVMPLSPFDDAIRVAAFKAIYGRDGFEKYAVQSLMPIRIIVENGNITLEGKVGNPLDKTMAGMAAKLVPGAFSVTNNLTIG